MAHGAGAERAGVGGGDTKVTRGGLPGDPVVETELPLEGHRFDPWSDPTCRGVQPINK